VLHSSRALKLLGMVSLSLVISPFCMADDEVEAPGHEFTAEQALQGLTAAIECRSSTHTQLVLSRNVWPVVLGDNRRVGSPFDAWTEVEQPNGSLHEIELPVPITVFGHETKRIAVLSEATMAILEHISLEDISNQLDMKPLSATNAPHIHLRELSLRNSGDDGIYVRSLTASRIASHPEAVLVGCEERYDTRTDQLRRRGKEPETRFAPGLDISKELDEVLSCKADALRNYTAGWAVIMGPLSTDARFKGWKSGEDDEGNRWWTLPAPIVIAGKPVSRFVKLGQTLYAELDGDIAPALAEEWALPSYDGWDETAFVRFHDTDTAADGWLEDRARIVRAWAPGKTLHGCEYQQNRPEFGEHPDDDDEE